MFASGHSGTTLLSWTEQRRGRRSHNSGDGIGQCCCTTTPAAIVLEILGRLNVYNCSKLAEQRSEGR